MTIHFKPSAKFDKEATVIFFDKNSLHHQKFAFSNASVSEKIVEALKGKLFTAELGQQVPLLHNRSLILLVGLGKKEDLSLTSLRIQVRKALLSSYLNKFKSIEVISHDQNTTAIQTLIEGILIGTYTWRKYKSKPKDDESVEDKDIFLVAAQKEAYDQTVTICAGATLTRNLINDNADTVTSEYLEDTIRTLVKGHKNVELEVLGRKEMEKKGLGLHLAVNQGSLKEPRLVIVKYTGNSGSKDYTALIGKGMTYDTGGLNLKPTGSMETMKTDMSGSAAVIGTLHNTLALKIKKNVIFAVALAENVIGSGAFKPGDVIRGYSGKTVEVANTDAEGRLVLADAFAYVIKNYKPERIIDIATLTGACVVALGNDICGLMSNDDDLANKLVQSSKETDDRVWRLPLYPELKEAVKSQMADIRNLGFPKGAAGALTAAEFLRQFTENTKWAHLDIAGTAYVEGGCRLYYGFGATGIGVRLLTHYLNNN
jgi:leucyl aminopeptidase